jgi:ADP-ribose pyrophosphatase
MKQNDLAEKTISTKRVFTGRALTIDSVSIEMPNGRKSTREIVRHRGAAVILGQRPDGKFVLVRQYRKSIEQTLLEVVAGGLEEGEAPEACARREMEEESGYAVLALEPIAVTVPCPGYSEERHYHYYAKIAQEPMEQRPDFDENLEPVIMSAEEINAAIDSGQIIDGKSITIWLLWQRKQDVGRTRDAFSG